MALQFLYGPICRADNDFGSGLMLAFYSNSFYLSSICQVVYYPFLSYFIYFELNLWLFVGTCRQTVFGGARPRELVHFIAVNLIN